MSIALVRARAVQVACVAGISLVVQGCIAAAIPFAIGGLAFSGLAAYKTVQMVGGGTVEIQFPSKDGKTLPPQSLPLTKKVAVWPGDEGEVMFAERLQSGGKFSAVTSPAAVSAILADSKTPHDLAQLTGQEQSDAFGLVCRKTGAGLVLGARPLGAATNSNLFSLSRANVTYSADLLGYSCEKRQVIWRDSIALVVGAGSSTTNTAEIFKAGADAWAERIEQAMNQPTVAAN